MIQPSHEILETFGVQVIAPLRGRMNQHWLVRQQQEQMGLRLWGSSRRDIDYELRLLTEIAALGWPVALAIGEPILTEGRIWSLFPFLPGEPRPASATEQRERGRLLAKFHADLAQLNHLDQRDNWRRCEEILQDPTLDGVLAAHEREQAEEVRIIRWHLDRARARIAGLQRQLRSGIIVHGDFTPWNLLYTGERLSGILEFELAHWDHRIGEFALAWRGRYDEVVHGYAEVSPLEPEEWELLTPMW